MTATTEAPAKTATKSRAKFHTLTVSEVRPLTDKSVEVTFAVPEALQDEYDYVAGQYVALRADIDGTQVRRSYSICEEPIPGVIKVAIKRDGGGVFSNWANDHLKAGDTMDVMSPQGAFISKHKLTSMNNPDQLGDELAEQGEAHFVAAAAGSGITPVIALTRTLLKHPGTTMDLIYQNRAAGDVMFLEELADLKDRYPSRLALHHVLSREQRISPMLTGRVDGEKLKQLLEHVVDARSVDEWFLCGPFEMVQLIRDELEATGVPAERVRYELFTTGKPTEGQGNVGRPVEADPDGDNFDIVFNLDGLSGQVASPKSSGESLLNAALRVRPDVPFACAGGVCGTCRARVVEGDVDMVENYALEPDDVAAGYVLTCRSFPKSDNVRLDFDG